MFSNAKHLYTQPDTVLYLAWKQVAMHHAYGTRCVLEIMGKERRSFSLGHGRKAEALPLLRVKEQRGDTPGFFFLPDAMRLLKLKACG
jgi:hypothetical protein